MKYRDSGHRLSHVLLLPLLLTCLVTCASDDTQPDELQRIIDLMQLRPGMQVADLGAGDGDWSEDLASEVGEGGKVWATEVDEDLVEDLRDRFTSVSQVQVVSGDDRSTGLPADCCDAILARLVYHHFTDPEAMRKELCRALRPQGRLLIVDIRPQDDWGELDGVPDRGGHGIPPQALIDEMTSFGFEVLDEDEDWPGDEDRYAVLFSDCDTP